MILTATKPTKTKGTQETLPLISIGFLCLSLWKPLREIFHNANPPIQRLLQDLCRGGARIFSGERLLEPPDQTIQASGFFGAGKASPTVLG